VRPQAIGIAGRVATKRWENRRQSTPSATGWRPIAAGYAGSTGPGGLPMAGKGQRVAGVEKQPAPVIGARARDPGVADPGRGQVPAMVDGLPEHPACQGINLSRAGTLAGAWPGRAAQSIARRAKSVRSRPCSAGQARFAVPPAIACASSATAATERAIRRCTAAMVASCRSGAPVQRPGAGRRPEKAVAGRSCMGFVRR
jgi:hypothetical protein